MSVVFGCANIESPYLKLLCVTFPDQGLLASQFPHHYFYWELYLEVVGRRNNPEVL